MVTKTQRAINRAYYLKHKNKWLKYHHYTKRKGVRSKISPALRKKNHDYYLKHKSAWVKYTHRDKKVTRRVVKAHKTKKKGFFGLW